MRRPILVLALLLAILPARAAEAGTSHHGRSLAHQRPSNSHPSIVHSHGGSSRRTRLNAGLALGRAHRAHGRRAGLRHVRRLRQIRERSNQQIATLESEQPGVDARIHLDPLDTVPLRGFRIPPAMKGSHDSLVRQNVRGEAEGLLRIENDDALLTLRQSRSLVALPVSESLRVDERLPENRRYCRGWTAQFLTDVARVHYSRFGRPLQVNSAVRTVAYQRKLGRVNGNAAAAEGDTASPHLTGATVDIAKKGLSMQEIGWMRAFLLPLETAGKLDVEEEFQQACFHITVYKSYGPAEQPQTVQHSLARSSALLATKVR